MRILFVKLGSIGDIIHTLPSLAAVRQCLPNAEISWVAEERSAEMLRDNPMLDRLIEIDTHSMRGGRIIEEIVLDLGKQVKSLRKYEFDVAIDFQGLWKSATIGKLSKAKVRWGFDKEALREPASRILLTNTASVPEGIHVIRKNLALVSQALKIQVPDTNFEFPLATATEHKAEALALVDAIGGSDFTLLNPAGGWVTKLWPAENYGVLADKIWDELRMPSIVVIGPKETELAERSAKASKCGKLMVAQPSLRGFYELAKLAKVYIGGDTGPTHIAVAAGAPIVGIFGPTEWWRNGSPRIDDICVERKDIGCRINCHRRTCNNWICMDIDVDSVMSSIRTRLSSVGKYSQFDQ